MTTEVVRIPWWVRFGLVIFIFVYRLKLRMLRFLKSDRLEGFVWITAVLLTIFDGCLLVVCGIGLLAIAGILRLVGWGLVVAVSVFFAYICFHGLCIDRKKNTDTKPRKVGTA